MNQRRPIDPEVLLEHARGVRDLAVALCRDGNDVDDVVQETWRVALERGLSVDPFAEAARGRKP